MLAFRIQLKGMLMKIAILSDIHGNHVALEKCVEYALAEGIEEFVFLGDYVGDMAYPQKTMAFLYNLQDTYKCHFIKGNKEEYWINYKANGEQGWKDNNSTTGGLLYTYNNLTSKDLSFFNRLPHTTEMTFEGMPSITICHGSPNKANEKLLPNDEKTFEIIDKDKNSLIIFGHTHRQMSIEHNGKIAINPGSVGVPLGSDGKAQFVIMFDEDGQWEYRFVSLDYDKEKMISEFAESGLDKKAPYWCEVTAYLLRTGMSSHATVLGRTMSLCRAETGVCNWPDIPEKYWELAVRELLCN